MEFPAKELFLPIFEQVPARKRHQRTRGTGSCLGLERWSALNQAVRIGEDRPVIGNRITEWQNAFGWLAVQVASDDEHPLKECRLAWVAYLSTRSDAFNALYLSHKRNGAQSLLEICNRENDVENTPKFQLRSMMTKVLHLNRKLWFMILTMCDHLRGSESERLLWQLLCYYLRASLKIPVRPVRATFVTTFEQLCTSNSNQFSDNLARLSWSLCQTRACWTISYL